MSNYKQHIENIILILNKIKCIHEVNQIGDTSISLTFVEYEDTSENINIVDDVLFLHGIQWDGIGVDGRKSNHIYYLTKEKKKELNRTQNLKELLK